jgi:hypothetical protein
MSRTDAFLLVSAAVALFSWYAITHQWAIGRLLERRWRFIRPYAASYVASSPATFVYAGIIAFTTWVVAGSNGRLANALLRAQSTNLSNLRHHATDVLIRSAFWSGYSYALPVIALMAIVLAPAEFWLGTGRAILVFAIGHVGGTLLTAAGIDLAVHFGHAPRGIENSIDVGVSYGTFCVAGVLTYRLHAPWRYLWLSGILGTLVLVAAVDVSFSDYGHVVSVLLGLACYPVTRAPKAVQRRGVPMYRPWLLENPASARVSDNRAG